MKRHWPWLAIVAVVAFVPIYCSCTMIRVVIVLDGDWAAQIKPGHKSRLTIKPTVVGKVIDGAHIGEQQGQELLLQKDVITEDSRMPNFVKIVDKSGNLLSGRSWNSPGTLNVCALIIDHPRNRIQIEFRREPISN